MEDLKAAAWVLRYGTRSLIHNLEALPPDRLTWKPEPGTKSALEMAGEVARALRMYQPLFQGQDCFSLPMFPEPASLAEATSYLARAAEEYAAALEAAGPELDRPQPMPFGAVFRASRAVLFPVMDLFHHHGQVCYLQSLLGDRETHWDEAAITEHFIAREAD